MRESVITFEQDEEGIRNLAIFIAQLVREGVTYTVTDHHGNYIVELTGGF